MEAESEVAVVLNGDDLFLSGESDSIDALLAAWFGSPDEADRQSLRTAVTDVAAVGATVGAVAATHQELFRLTAKGAELVRSYGLPLNADGNVAGVARSGSRIAGHLSFETVSFGAEQALAIQTAAVTLALRSAIADVQKAVEAVGDKVDTLNDRLEGLTVGQVLGSYKRLKAVSDKTLRTGVLVEADWDTIAATAAGLEQSLEAQRHYVRLRLQRLKSSDRIPKRAERLKDLQKPGDVAGALRLISICQQALHLFEYLHVERVRSTESSEHVVEALADARRSLQAQRQANVDLVRAAVDKINEVRVIEPLETGRFLSIPDLKKHSSRALDLFEEFARSSDVELPRQDRKVHRPSLAEARDEAQRRAIEAKDDTVDISRDVGRAVAKGATRATETVRRKLNL